MPNDKARSEQIQRVYGQFAYYVCQSIMKRDKDSCDTPRLNARRFEELVVGKIRSNILTKGSITGLVKAVDEEMDGIARKHRKRLRIIEDELEDVKRKLGRIWHVIETIDIEMTERGAFIETFVKAIVVMPGDSLIPGRVTEKVALSDSVLSTVRDGGAEGIRTPDPLLAKQVLSRLSYSPNMRVSGGAGWSLAVSEYFPRSKVRQTSAREGSVYTPRQPLPICPEA